MKKFKSKKKRKKLKLKLFIFVFFFIFSYVFMVKLLSSNKLKDNILKDDVNYVRFNLSKTVENQITKLINNPINLLNKNVKNAFNNVKTASKTIYENKELKEALNVDINNPIIYIYNTHQTETYADYSVYDAAYLLKEKLNQAGLSSYLEEQSMKVFLDTNGLKYYNSYTASRNYLDLAKNNYSSLKYFFDIHRDSVSKDISTITYNGKSYAKVLFVVGTDNPNNALNKETTNKLNEIIKSKVPNISRGIVYHGGKGFNGVYNQDVSSEVFLIEVGGKDNTKEEVENTIEVLNNAIVEYIKGII